jgi:oxaloacetate decarboxylase gamma subunit
MDNLGIGLLLMVVGMVTVFIILLIVIYLSKILISLVNKFAPSEEPVKVSPQRAIADNESVAAIKAAVKVLTAGKGKVVKIEKL